MANIFLSTTFLSQVLYIGVIHLSDSLNEKGASSIT